MPPGPLAGPAAWRAQRPLRSPLHRIDTPVSRGAAAHQFDAQGKIHGEILDAYWRCGFYVFEGVIGEVEISELRVDVERVLRGAPARPGAVLDKAGNPALGSAYDRPSFNFAAPSVIRESKISNFRFHRNRGRWRLRDMRSTGLLHVALPPVNYTLRLQNRRILVLSTKGSVR
jgi:hypothetical protein